MQFTTDDKLRAVAAFLTTLRDTAGWDQCVASAPVAPTTDRAMLQSVLQDLEKSESVCPRCGHSDSCADMDVVHMIRDHLKGDASAPVAEQAALFAQSTTKDDKAALGMLECGKPLCAPGEHHPLCRNGWAEKKGASAPTPKPWPVEEQPDGTVTPVDPVDLASAPVADAAPEYAYSDDGRTVTMTNAHRAPGRQASAPVAEDDEVERIRGRGPAYPYTPNTAPSTPLASAPVAGEAVTWEAVRQELAIFLMGATGRSSKEWHRPLDNASEGGALAKMRACLAAPQASAENVRNAALEEAARLMEQTGKRIAASDIRALKTQADKDGAEQALKDLVTHGVSVQRIAPADFLAGGQQRAGDVVRDALWTLTEHNALHFGEQHSTVIQGRAALSAPQAEQGGAKP